MQIREKEKEIAGPDYYHLGIWFAGFASLGKPYADVMVKAFRHVNTPLVWEISARIRRIKDDKIWGSEDTKQWHDKKMFGTEAEVIEHIDKFCKETSRDFTRLFPEEEPAIWDFLEIRCSASSPEFLDKLVHANRPWLHIKQLKKGEETKMEGTEQ
jgi:hypothetical protein